MTTSEWITVGAIVCGPILAVQAQKWTERIRDKKNRRLSIFKTLMATRATVLSPIHVESLNMIDLEFNGKGKTDKEIRRRWKEYLDNLASLTQNAEQQREQLPSWTQRNQDLLADLLLDMGKAVGYDFDKVQIRRGIYSPMGHANLELETQLIRRFLVELSAGRQALPLDIRSWPLQPPPPPPNQTITTHV